MRFEAKIAIASFSLCAGAAALTAGLTYASFEGRVVAAFTQRYDVLAATIGSTFRQLDVSSDRVSRGAVLSLANQLSETKKIPSNQELKRLRDLVGTTSLDLIARDGTFIRSSSFPEFGSYNLYAYCEGYHRVFSGRESVVRTPIMPSRVFGRGIKFHLVALRGSKYALNVGYELNVIGQTLVTALRSDPNIRSVGLYTPSGRTLGEYVNEAKSPGGEGDVYGVSSRVDPTETYCCECARNGLTIKGQSDYYYVLKMTVSRATLHAEIRRLRLTTGAILLVALMLSLLAAKLIARALVARVNELSRRASEIMRSKQLSSRIGVHGRDEISALANQFDEMLGSLETAQRDLLAIEKDKTFAEVASQVSHDIRSPLTALQLLLSQVSDWPEQQRILARAAISRITDIANSLLERSKQTVPASDSVSGVARTTELLPATLETLVSEMRLSARARSGLDIELHLEDSYGSFVTINALQFKRAMSNLINNACEAITAPTGSIHVRATKTGARIRLTVTDNGRGMPEHILKHLGTRGLTYGKSGPASGTGLGVYHAKQTFEAAGGSFHVDSTEGVGTTVTIDLPAAPAPSWFVERLEVPVPGAVISVDDDRAIHQIWSDRLAEIGFAAKGGRHLRFTSGRDVFATEDTVLFLIDYELGPAGEPTGLDVVRRLKVADRAILVTSRYEEHDLRDACERLGVRMIPKGMAPLVPIATTPGYQPRRDFTT